MKRYNFIVVFALLFITGCSVAPYAPVAGLAAAGADRASLRDKPEYAKLIGVPFSPTSNGPRIWALRKFTKGRYFIEKSDPNKNYTPFVCDLAGGQITILDIFEDRINGGVHYSARAQCPGGASVDAPRNHFYNELLKFPTSAMR